MLLFGHDFIQVMIVIILISLEYIAIIGGMYFYLYYKPKRLNLIRNPTLVKPIRKDYLMKEANSKGEKIALKELYKKDLQQYKNTVLIDKVPEYTGRITVIILRENKWSKILYFSGDITDFTYGKCLYFITTPHSCDNGAKLLIYLEGISLPVSYENVQKETITKKFIDLDGQEKYSQITVIKGLKWDGKILHIFTNRKFAEIFTKIEPDVLPLLIFIIGTITLIISCIGIGVTYFT